MNNTIGEIFSQCLHNALIVSIMDLGKFQTIAKEVGLRMNEDKTKIMMRNQEVERQLILAST